MAGCVDHLPAIRLDGTAPSEDCPARANHHRAAPACCRNRVQPQMWIVHVPTLSCEPRLRGAFQSAAPHALRSRRPYRQRRIPAGKDRLHDLIAESDPLHTIDQRAIAHSGRRRRAQTKHDFRFDTGFAENHSTPRPARPRARALLRLVVYPQTGDLTPNTLHIWRFVKPIFRPVILSPRTSKAARSIGVTR